jgi:hypothetical protein
MFYPFIFHDISLVSIKKQKLSFEIIDSLLVISLFIA